MSDWFLRTHGVPGAPLCFDMGGLWSVVSIRDQMLRAQELVRRLHRAGALSSSRDLLVIGAGAAGATAALEAAYRGIACRVIDRAATPFGPQAACHSRWVDPTQYDWPMPHWRDAQYPWPRRWSLPPALPTPPPVTRAPVPWHAAPAAHLAIAWNARLLAARRAGAVTVDYATRLIGVRPRMSTMGTLVDVETQRAGAPVVTHTYGAVLGATGMGNERVTLNHYTSWRFWQSDTIELPNCGVPRSTPATVLISGVGDGALQDFLRATTGQSSAASIWQALVSGGANPAAPFDLFAELLAAEDHMKCAYACADEPDEHYILQEIHERTELAARRWYHHHRGAIARVLSPWLAGRPQVDLVYPCTHFGKAYMLNRFLTHVILEHDDASVSPSVTRLPQCKLVDVWGRGHSCGGPATCVGKDHDVSLVQFARCGGPAGAALTSVVRNVVVLRHGIQPASAVFGAAPSGPFKQVMPQYPMP